MQTKTSFREFARTRRQAVDRRAERSAAIAQRLLALPVWQAARTIGLYVDFRDEVQTGLIFDAATAEAKRVAVPWCRADTSLDFYRLESRSELEPGKFGILNLAKSLRSQPARLVAPAEFDLVVIPGLAFDHAGQRIGYGKGYYDRLIRHLRPTCCRIALAFDAQMFDQVPTEPHDVPLHLVITESALYGSPP